jgi:hypothetical protein
MIGPAAGAARMLAGSAANGMPPKRATSIGATASCAAIVTDAPSANHRGPGSRAAIDGASSTMPAVANSDSWKPTERVMTGRRARASCTSTR